MPGAYQTINVRYRSKRRRINHPAFTNSRSPQVFDSGQTVTPTGSSISIRPPATAIRRYDTKGTGTVRYF